MHNCQHAQKWWRPPHLNEDFAPTPAFRQRDTGAASETWLQPHNCYQDCTVPQEVKAVAHQHTHFHKLLFVCQCYSFKKEKKKKRNAFSIQLAKGFSTSGSDSDCLCLQPANLCKSVATLIAPPSRSTLSLISMCKVFPQNKPSVNQAQCLNIWRSCSFFHKCPSLLGLLQNIRLAHNVENRASSIKRLKAYTDSSLALLCQRMQMCLETVPHLLALSIALDAGQHAGHAACSNLQRNSHLMPRCSDGGLKDPATTLVIGLHPSDTLTR